MKKLFKKVWEFKNKILKFILLTLVIIFSIIKINDILNWVPTRDFITILPALKFAIFLLIIIGLSIFTFKKELNIEKHQGITNSLLVIITIIFTFSVYFIDRQNTFYNINTGLVRANEVNNEIANAIMRKDYSMGYPWIFFLTEPYEKNMTFITKNFTSSECVTNYYRLMMEMRIINDVQKSVVMHTVEESSVADLIYNKANSVSDLIQKISKECHPPNSSILN